MDTITENTMDTIAQNNMDTITENTMETARETVKSVENGDKEKIEQVTLDYAPATLTEETQILFEDLPGTEVIEKREANIKHFDLGNGRHQAIVYPEPVHFKDGNEWKEYDNELIEISGRAECGTLRNRTNELSMEFAQQAIPGEPVITLSHAGRQLSWTFERIDSIDASCEMRNEATDESNAKNDAKSDRTITRIDMPRSVAEVRQGEELLRSCRSDTVVTESAPLTEQDMRTELLGQESEVTYKDLLPGVSVRYRLCGGQLKEYIELQDYSAYAATVLRLPKGFEYRVQPDNSVLVLDEKTNEQLFIFDMPITVDSDGSETIASVSLKDDCDSVIMRYILDEEYLKKAKYPITIDPTTYLEPKAGAVTTSTRTWNGTTGGVGNTGFIASGLNGSTENYAFIRFNQLVPFRARDTVVSAYLQARRGTYAGSATCYVAAYEIKKPWTNAAGTSISIPTSFNPSDPNNVSETALDYVSGTSAAASTFEISDLFRRWYLMDGNQNLNHGVALRRPDGAGGNTYFQQYANGSNTTYGPRMIVNYISRAGIQGFYTYDGMAAGRAGSASVDLFNGNVIMAHPDTQMTGSRMPVSITHYYNSCDANGADDEYYCGKGWRLSIQQHVVSSNRGGTDYYIWRDGEGTDHFFPATGSQPYRDQSGLGMELRVSGSGASGYVTITNKQGAALKFTTNSAWKDGSGKQIYCLSVISDALKDSSGNPVNKATVDFVTANSVPVLHKVLKVTDGVGRVTNLTYNSAGLLQKISAPGNPAVTYTYTNNNLTGIGYSDITSGGTTYQYTASGLLTSAQNYDGLKLAIGYEPASLYNPGLFDSPQAAEQMRRATSMELSNGAVAGARKLIGYKLGTTEVTAVDSTDANATAGKKLIYQFNNSGNLIAVCDELGYGKFAKYGGDAPENHPSETSKLQKAVVNRLLNIDFSSMGASGTKWITSGSTVTRDTANRCMGAASARIVRASSGAETKVFQTITVERGRKWTFSAYAKTSGLSGGDAFVRLSQGAVTGLSVKLTGTTDADAGGANAQGWERLYATIELTGSGTVAVIVELVSNGSGTAYFSAPQLEEGAIANPVNFVFNGDFRYPTAEMNGGIRNLPEGWTGGTDIVANAKTGLCTPTDPPLPSALSGRPVQIYSMPHKTAMHFNQEMPISGSKDDVIVIGGWADGKSVPLAGKPGAQFGLGVRFLVGSTWSASNAANELMFNEEHVGWQFGCRAIKAPGNYTAIRLYILDSANANYARFSNLFLNKDQFGESFIYNKDSAKGSMTNVVSSTKLTGKTANMDYDKFNNMTSYIKPGRVSSDKYVMSYGTTDTEREKRQLKNAVTPLGVRAEYEYDAYGNQKQSAQTHTANSVTAKITSKTDYNANGNYAVKSTDPRGNAVEYDVDPITGNVDGVMDPHGKVKLFEYDSQDRVTQAMLSVGDGPSHVVAKNNYTYENDRLKTVKHNTQSNPGNEVTYFFTYDELGNPVQINVGGLQPLSTNVYTADRGKKLSIVAYGNGGAVRYAYDAFDRVRGVAYDGSYPASNPRYSYEYGANGAVGRVTDNNLGRVTDIEYDLANRPMLTTVRAANGDLIYRSQLDYDKCHIIGHTHSDTGCNNTAKGNLTRLRETVDTASYQTAYLYDKDDRVVQAQYGSASRMVAYTYDGLNRVETRNVHNGNASTPAGTAIYSYAAGSGSNQTTPLVSKIDQQHIPFEYIYDAMGNITREKRGALTAQYLYDSLNQLNRVNDPQENASWRYRYDMGGNLTSKIRYAYSTASDPGPAMETINYSYIDSNWKDKLTAYNGTPVYYDYIGNVTNDGTWAYTWQAAREHEQERHISSIRL